MVLTLVVGEGEADGDALLVARLGLVGGVRFVELGPRLGAVDVLDAGEVEQFTGLGGVQDVARGDGAAGAVAEVLQGDGAHDIVVGLGGHRPVLGEDGEPSGCPVRGEHALQDGEGDARLVAELADPAGARVEVGEGGGLGAQGVPLPVVLADALAQSPVGGGGAELFDPRVLVGRHGLAGELAADPVRLLGQDDAAAGPAGGEGRGDAAESAADDEDVGFRYHAAAP
ncbi:hypothetical protein SVIOM342S_01811 [Streptomyces violaceorubidus]